MILTIAIVAIAFFWLLYETDFMRTRLETTAYQKANQGKVNAGTDSNATPYKPSKFTPAEMPEMAGNLNILCMRE